MIINPLTRTITPVWSVLAGPWSVRSHRCDQSWLVPGAYDHTGVISLGWSLERTITPVWSVLAGPWSVRSHGVISLGWSLKRTITPVWLEHSVRHVINCWIQICFRALTGAEPDRTRWALVIITNIQCFQSYNAYFRFQTVKYT